MKKLFEITIDLVIWPIFKFFFLVHDWTSCSPTYFQSKLILELFCIYIWFQTFFEQKTVNQGIKTFQYTFKSNRRSRTLYYYFSSFALKLVTENYELSSPKSKRLFRHHFIPSQSLSLPMMIEDESVQKYPLRLCVWKFQENMFFFSQNANF